MTSWRTGSTGLVVVRIVDVGGAVPDVCHSDDVMSPTMTPAATAALLII